MAGCVWFIRRVALPKIWLAKILVDVSLTMNWPTLAKHELKLVVAHWHAKKLAIIQTGTKYFDLVNKLVRYSLVTVQT
jgi:hypothetical protein